MAAGLADTRMAGEDARANRVSIVDAGFHAVDHAACVANCGEAAHEAFFRVLCGAHCRFVGAQRFHFVAAARQRQVYMRIDQARNYHAPAGVQHAVKTFMAYFAGTDFRHEIVFNRNKCMFAQCFVVAVKNAAIRNELFHILPSFFFSRHTGDRQSSAQALLRAERELPDRSACPHRGSAYGNSILQAVPTDWGRRL